jgi:hypothetical protein
MRTPAERGLAKLDAQAREARPLRSPPPPEFRAADRKV